MHVSAAAKLVFYSYTISNTTNKHKQKMNWTLQQLKQIVFDAHTFNFSLKSNDNFSADTEGNVFNLVVSDSKSEITSWNDDIFLNVNYFTQFLPHVFVDFCLFWYDVIPLMNRANIFEASCEIVLPFVW